MQPSVYGKEYLHALRACSVGHCIFPPPCTGNCPSWREPRETGRSRLEGFINHLVSRHLEEYRETVDMILEESLPGRP